MTSIDECAEAIYERVTFTRWAGLFGALEEVGPNDQFTIPVGRGDQVLWLNLGGTPTLATVGEDEAAAERFAVSPSQVGFFVETEAPDEDLAVRAAAALDAAVLGKLEALAGLGRHAGIHGSLLLVTFGGLYVKGAPRPEDSRWEVWGHQNIGAVIRSISLQPVDHRTQQALEPDAVREQAS